MLAPGVMHTNELLPCPRMQMARFTKEGAFRQNEQEDNDPRRSGEIIAVAGEVLRVVHKSFAKHIQGNQWGTLVWPREGKGSRWQQENTVEVILTASRCAMGDGPTMAQRLVRFVSINHDPNCAAKRLLETNCFEAHYTPSTVPYQQGIQDRAQHSTTQVFHRSLAHSSVM